jgi:hypothetical protein
MNRSMKLVSGIALVLLFAAGATVVSAQTAAQERYQVTVSNIEGCPIQIYERKTRVSNTLVRHPWTALNGKDPRKDQLREYGSGESQLVYDIAFRNSDLHPVAGVAFLWEALDADGAVLFKRLDTWTAEPVEPGRYGTLHEIDTAPIGAIATYRISVFQVHLVDGSAWTPAGQVDG